ncbi:MAG: phosphatidate cytidylyltransferase [Rikenellaceae bacterium]|nr:phosphatidate cytidylyltransferase [Rikenellaceae bacterium]
MNKEKLKNLTVRTLSGAVLAAVLFGATLISGYGYVALMAVVAAVGVWEFYNLCEGCGYKPQRYLGATLALVVYAFAALAFVEVVMDGCHWSTSVVWIVLALIPLLMFGSFILELFRNYEHPIANVGVTLMGAVYVALPVSAMLAVPQLLSGQGNWLPWYAICYILIIWANDVFAYLVGMTLGRHRMCERISPKKSWEGFVGGVVAAVGFAVLFGYLLGGNIAVWAGLGAIIAITGVAGDFVESLFKRSAGVKDSGAIMPGHGGILDRFDALLISAPFAFIYLLMTNL